MNAKPVVLALFANNEEEVFLKSLTEEADRIKAYWKPLKGSIEVICENYVERKKLAEYLDEYRERLIGLHFGGHANGENLIFEDGAVSNESIVYKLKNEVKYLQFVFLNGCSTEGHVEKLIKECKINFVIATRSAIDDQKAQQFSAWFYQNLYAEEEIEDGIRYKKRSLQAAYESALGNLKINFSDEDWDDTIEIVNTQRGLGHPPLGNPWKLYVSDVYKHEYPWWIIANLKLTNAPSDKNYLKIFCIYRITTELTDYYNEFEAVTQNKSSLLINGITKVSSVINKEAIISEIRHADILLFLLDESNQFANFWNELALGESYKNKNTILVNIKHNPATHELLKTTYRITPSYEIPSIFPFFKTIKNYNINSIPDEVTNIVYPEFNTQIEKITQEIPNQLRQIDLIKQQEIFDSQWGKNSDKKVKLILVEGSDKCGQLTLIKRFLDIGLVNRDCLKQLISFKSSGIDTVDKLYEGLKSKFGSKLSSQSICNSLLQISTEIILVFDDVISTNFDGRVAVRDFWTQLNEYAKITAPKSQIIIFVISRNYNFNQREIRTLTDFIGSDNCAVIDLEPIVPIEETHWKRWKTGAKAVLKKSDEEIENFQCPLPFPAYLQEVILETGKILQVPSTFIIDNI